MPSSLLPTQEICASAVHCSCIRATLEGRQAERPLSCNPASNGTSVTLPVEILSTDSDSISTSSYWTVSQPCYLPASHSSFNLLIYNKQMITGAKYSAVCHWGLNRDGWSENLCLAKRFFWDLHLLIVLGLLFPWDPRWPERINEIGGIRQEPCKGFLEGTSMGWGERTQKGVVSPSVKPLLSMRPESVSGRLPLWWKLHLGAKVGLGNHLLDKLALQQPPRPALSTLVPWLALLWHLATGETGREEYWQWIKGRESSINWAQ